MGDCNNMLAGSNFLAGIIIPPSPIPGLLGTNSTPSAFQQETIRVSLASMEQDVKRLDQDILRVQAVLNQLQKERVAVQQYFELHEAFLTPARRLYPELVAEIFKHCAKGSTKRHVHDVLDTFDPDCGPLLLTQICSSWRSIAISTPDLWTAIRLTVKESSPSQIELVKTWVKRSADNPLSVAIMESKDVSQRERHSQDGLSSFRDWADNEALELLVKQAYRWKDAHLVIPPSRAAWQVFSSLHHNLPILERLTVNISRRLLSPPELVIDYFSSAPQLRNVSLDYATSIRSVLTSTLCTLELPYAQLVSLDFRVQRQTPATINACLAAISETPNLKRCVLRCGVAEPWSPIVSLVYHENLKHLVVVAEQIRAVATESDMAKLFDRLDLPSLETLEIRSTCGRAWNHAAFCNFLARSPDLTYFTLVADEISISELIETLWETPKVSQLTIIATEGVNHGLIRFLAFADGTHGIPAFLSRLQNLQISTVNATQAYPPFFIKMLEQRTIHSATNKVAHFKIVNLGRLAVTGNYVVKNMLPADLQKFNHETGLRIEQFPDSISCSPFP